uniref:Uncharacterized protein n=1 Tax=Ditylum brightwellii TaxID=49249 RepID=A0A6U4A160_9STRA|mmetsp:Transcript_2240/g.3524  ORF Transcript_2240/g.3524 Transcript_2240/m.3524 type:complete len:190 (+) Transcript_2240:142-711(+)
MFKSVLLFLALDYLLLSIYETRSLILDTIENSKASNVYTPIVIGGCCIALRCLRSTIFETDKVNVIAAYKLLTAIQLARIAGYASLYDMLPSDEEEESGEDISTVVEEDNNIMKRFIKIILFKDTFMLIFLFFSIFWETSGNIRKTRHEKEVTMQQEFIRAIHKKQEAVSHKGPSKKLKIRQRSRRREE